MKSLKNIDLKYTTSNVNHWESIAYDFLASELDNPIKDVKHNFDSYMGMLQIHKRAELARKIVENPAEKGDYTITVDIGRDPETIANAIIGLRSEKQRASDLTRVGKPFDPKSYFTRLAQDDGRIYLIASNEKNVLGVEEIFILKDINHRQIFAINEYSIPNHSFEGSIPQYAAGMALYLASMKLCSMTDTLAIVADLNVQPKLYIGATQLTDSFRKYGDNVKDNETKLFDAQSVARKGLDVIFANYNKIK